MRSVWFALSIALVWFADCASGQVVTNQVSHIAFVERLSSTPHFVHAGPIAGDYITIDENGTYNFQATLSLEGADVTQFDESTVFVLTVHDSAGLVFSTAVHLSDDPHYRSGKTKATFKKYGTFKGKQVLTERITLKISPILGTLRLSVAGRYMARRLNGNVVESVGDTVRAEAALGLPDTTVRDTSFVGVAFGQELGMYGVVGIGPMEIGGKVTTRTVHDHRNELPDAQSSRVVLIGTSPP